MLLTLYSLWEGAGGPSGITQPGGAGTTIYYYDDTLAPDAIAYHFANLSTAFPVDFVDLGTNPKSYRSKVSIQCGDTTTGTATTTLSDTNVTVIFDSTKTWLFRTTQTSSWFTKLGTKLGTGNQASGRSGCNIILGGVTTFRGTLQVYGSKIVIAQPGQFTINPGVGGLTQDFVNCILETTGTSTTSNFNIGPSGNVLSNLYNVDFVAAVGSSAGMAVSFGVTAAERLTFGGNPISYIRSAQTTLSIKDAAFFGTPTTADMVCQVDPVPGWDIVRPRWTGTAPRFGSMTVTAGNIRERWVFDVKVVDRNGDPIAGIPVKLTDSISSVQVNTTTDSSGQVTFGSGLTANTVIVRDHYGSASYLTRDRSPFTAEINTGAGANGSYLSRTYAFDWPGLSTGNFEDVTDIVSIQDPAGAPTTWVEHTVP